MKKEDLINLGLENEMADKVMELAGSGEKEALDMVTSFNEQINQLKAENTALKSDYDGYRISTAVENALLQAGAKNITAAKALINNDNIQLDESGAVTGVNEQVKALLDNPETAFLFERETVQLKGASQAGEARDTSLDFNTQNMNYSQLCAYLEENPDAQI